MVEPQGEEESGHAVEDEAPREGFLVAEPQLQRACQRHQSAIAEDDGQPVECVTDAHEPSLMVLVEFEHVVAVGGNVVRGTRKRHEEEAEHGALKPERRIERERYACQRRAEQGLHGQHPPALGLVEVDKRAPEGLDDPRQAEPAGVERNICVAHAQLHVHHYGHAHHNHVGKAFGHVESWNPTPGISMFHHNNH